MLLILNNTGFVIAYNTVRPKESVDNTKNEVWYDGDFSFGMGEYIEGKIKMFKYVNGEIEIVYFDAPSESVAPVPTQLDRIEAKLQTNEDLQNFYDEIVEEVGL